MLPLVSCIDIYQHISKEKNGNINIYLKASLSKAMLAMAELDSESQDICEDLFDTKEMEYFSELPEEIKINLQRIESDYECGLSFEMSLDTRSELVQEMILSDEMPFLPRITNEKLIIEFPSSDESYTFGQEMGIAFLSAFKYRLTIGKTITPRITRAILSTDEIDYKLKIVSLPDIFTIEIPLSYLVYADTGSALIIDF